MKISLVVQKQNVYMYINNMFDSALSKFTVYCHIKMLRMLM